MGIWQWAWLTWARSESVTVFTENCVEKWQFGQGSLSRGKRRTGVGLSHCWKPSRLIRRHLRIQKADSSCQLLFPPFVWQECHHNWISVWGSSGAGRPHDSSGIILQPTCRMCKQHWSIWRSCYKCLQLLKMTDHYNTGAEARGVANMDHGLEIN